MLDGPVKIALITLNPGGNVNPPNHSTASCESGVSYLVESWVGSPPGQSKLQIQVQRLFLMLNEVSAYHGSYQELMAESLIAHFIPFRSPRFANLHQKSASIDFGHHLWRQLLPVSSPKLIICLGRDVQTELRKLIPITTGSRLEISASFPTGWGAYTAEIDEFNTQSETIRLLYLPHLSTFTLFTSPKCANYMPAIIRAACANL